MKFINLTPHDIVLNDGTVYHSSGVARLTDTYSDFDADRICSVTYGGITNLPLPEPGIRYIVSSMVLTAGKAMGRTDLVAPATGHPECKRQNGEIISVPGFII